MFLRLMLVLSGTVQFNESCPSFSSCEVPTEIVSTSHRQEPVKTRYDTLCRQRNHNRSYPNFQPTFGHLSIVTTTPHDWWTPRDHTTGTKEQAGYKSRQDGRAGRMEEQAGRKSRQDGRAGRTEEQAR
jgi:hypothetical protein